MSVNASVNKSAPAYDAVVIGSGSTGGWAAKELGERGLRVLVLDAGAEVTLDQINPPRPRVLGRRFYQRFVGRRQPIQQRHGAYAFTNPDLFVDDLDNPYTTPSDRPFDWIRGRNVGGRSLTWGRVCLRISDYEFKAASRDGFGDDWPIGYADLAPYYDRVEEFLGVCGSRDGLAQVPDGRFRNSRAMTSGERRFKDTVEARFCDRNVVMLRGIPGSEGGLDYQSDTWPASTSQGSTLAAALRTRRVTVRANSVVSHIVVDTHSGRAKGVAFIDRESHAAHEIPARVIVLCASAIESTRILLNSATRQHPAGLGNSSGLLGRYLMDHINASALAVVRDGGGRPSSDFLGPDGIMIPCFVNLKSRHPKFIRGYSIWGAIQRWPIQSLLGIRGRLLRLAHGNAPAFLLAQGEALPRLENRVEINRNVTDAWGIPTAHIDYTWTDNDLAMVSDMKDALVEMIESVGGRLVAMSGPGNPGLFVHECGTARMGTNSRTSVLNAFNQCWDVPNVFVLDGACWVSGGWQNPTLTMMAIAARGCDFLVEGLRRGDL